MNIIRYNHILLLIAFIGTSQLWCGEAAAEDERWVVASVKGGAWKSSDRDPSVRTAVREGDAVSSSDRLETFQQNEVTLTSDPAGKNIITVQGAFRMQQTPGVTRVQLERGRALAVLDGLKGQGDFSVVTPTGVAAVRGTRFGVDAPYNRMEVRTYQGEVMVRGNSTGRKHSGGASVSLEKGRKTVLESGTSQAPRAEDISVREWKKYREEFQGIRTARKALKEDGGRWFDESKEPSRVTWVPSDPASGQDGSKDGQTIVF
jgi:hypothetical protein